MKSFEVVGDQFVVLSLVSYTDERYAAFLRLFILRSCFVLCLSLFQELGQTPVDPLHFLVGPAGGHVFFPFPDESGSHPD